MSLERKPEAVSKQRLTKKELNQIWRRFAWSFPAACSWERFLGMQYSWSLIRYSENIITKRVKLMV